MTIPPAVSKRNNFHPAEEFVENAMPHLPQQFQHANFQAWLLRYTELVIKRVATHFGTAANRGIEQAEELLCDPDFYETNKKRRDAQTRSWKEQREKQELERIERRTCPTAEQIAQEIKWSTDQLAYHKQEIEKHNKVLEHLNELKPKNIRLVPSKK